jgi:hypothetical protein
VGGAHADGVDLSGEIALRINNRNTSCGGAPNGFVWINPDSSGGTCPHPLRVGVPEGALNSGAISRGCARALDRIVRNPRPVPVAIYRSGGSGDVETAGIAMFVPTGWRYRPGFWPEGPRQRDRQSDLSGRKLCDRDPATMCLYGYFTTKIFSADTVPSGDHYGAIVVRTIG